MLPIVRSVFWLAAAYLVLKPGAELPDAGALTAQAMAAGKQVVAEQVEAIACDSFECLGGKAVVAAALRDVPSVGAPMHEQPTVAPVPYPRPRLDRAS